MPRLKKRAPFRPAPMPSKMLRPSGDPGVLDVVGEFAARANIGHLPGAEHENHRWRLHLSRPAVGRLREWEKLGYHISDDAITVAHKYAAHMKRLAEISKALEADPDGIDPRWLQPSNNAGYEPFPYQVAGIQALVEARRSFLADEVGGGKTMMGIRTIDTLGGHPCLVVAPKTMLVQWVEEVDEWTIDGRSAAVMRGNDPIPSTDYVVISWGMLARRIGDLIRGEWQGLIGDEFHKVKNYKAQRSKALKHIVEAYDTPHRFGLGASPQRNSPDELIQQALILGVLPKLGGFKWFKNAYCNGAGSAALLDMHENLHAAGFVRRLKMDFMPQLPPKRRNKVMLDVALKQYEDTRRDVLSKLLGLDLDTARGINAGVTEMNRLKKEAALAKMPAIVGWLEDFLAGDGKIIVFAHHHDVIDRLYAPFEDNAIKLTGKVTSDKRRRDISRQFQEDPDTRLFIGSSAAGEGITLTAAWDTVVTEFPWSPEDLVQWEGRSYGRAIDPHEIDVHLMVARGTVDERILASLADKEADITTGIDGGRVRVVESDAEIRRNVARRVIEEEIARSAA